VITQNLINYEKNERYLADKLFQHIPTIENVEYTSGHICYDAIITLKNQTKIISEFKVRSFEANKYPDYILQVDKLVNLTKRKKQNNYDMIYYINFFQGKDKTNIEFIIFNLSGRKEQWQQNKPIIKKMWMNAETHKSTTFKVEKQVILLQYDEKIDMRGNFILN